MKFLLILAVLTSTLNSSLAQNKAPADQTKNEFRDERLNSLEKEVALLRKEAELQEKSSDKILQIVQNFGGAFLVVVLALIGLNLYNNRNLAKETAKDEVEKLTGKFNDNLNEIIEKNRESSLLLETLRKAYSVIREEDNENTKEA
jgi:hypothetical protein